MYVVHRTWASHHDGCRALSALVHCVWTISSIHTAVTLLSLPPSHLTLIFRSVTSHIFLRGCVSTLTPPIAYSNIIRVLHRGRCEMLQEHLQPEDPFSNGRTLAQPELGNHFQDRGRDSCRDTREEQRRVLVVAADILTPQMLLAWLVTMPASSHPSTVNVFYM